MRDLVSRYQYCTIICTRKALATASLRITRKIRSGSYKWTSWLLDLVSSRLDDLQAATSCPRATWRWCIPRSYSEGSLPVLSMIRACSVQTFTFGQERDPFCAQCSSNASRKRLSDSPASRGPLPMPPFWPLEWVIGIFQSWIINSLADDFTGPVGAIYSY